MSNLMDLDVIVRHESGTRAYWGEVAQFPGCFAAGHSLDEFEDALQEAILLYLRDESEAALPSSDHIEEVRRYRLSEDRRLVRICT
jgi:predicted RNase H-like HicB family nuclease